MREEIAQRYEQRNKEELHQISIVILYCLREEDPMKADLYGRDAGPSGPPPSGLLLVLMSRTFRRLQELPFDASLNRRAREI